MINKIIILVLVLGMIPLANAFTEGQIVTQRQIDNFPLGNYETIHEMINLLQCQLVGEPYKWNGWYYKPFSCLTIKRNEWNGTEWNYIIYGKNFFPKIHIQSYRDCVAIHNEMGYDKTECVAEYKSQLNGYAKNKIRGIMSFLNGLKTPNDDGFDGDDFGGGLW